MWRPLQDGPDAPALAREGHHERLAGRTDVSGLQVALNELTAVSEPLYSVA